MDGKPQRPVNLVRGVDENAIKPELQKQKSTGALSMSAIGGGLRAAAKRTAFHDRSNIAKNVPLGNNGSVLDTKGYEVKKPDIAASLLARRSVPALSQLLAEQTQPMNIQRVAAKRTNAVFKDPEYEQSAEGLTSFDLKNFPAILDGKLMKQGDALAVTTNSKTSSAGEFMAGGVAGSGGANTPDSEQSREAEQKAHVHGSYLTTIDALKNASESTSGAAAAADYELWEFEEDEGYTTSYSFRSRDNTTGFITTVLYPKFSEEVRKEIESAAEVVAATTNEAEAEEEAWDITMVAEYSEEIFQHLREVELDYMPHWNYMSRQGEIQWSMRSVLLDWIVQVHGRFGLLPETLYLLVNCIDRFLQVKTVSLGKLQLVGITALYCAAKYEEVVCPAVHELQYMVENGYSQDEILKAERYMLGMLDFRLGSPGPLSFLRRISKADEYDLMTRTVAKYFIELTIMDERFIGLPPSFIAAGGHYAARLVLKKPEWTAHHVHYSGYTFKQILPLVCLMLSCCENAQRHHVSIFHKYADKRYKRASLTVLAELSKGLEIPGHRGRFYAFSQYLQDPPNMMRGPYFPPL